MLVTLFGIVMLVRLLQFSNAAEQMLVTLSGIVMLVRLLQEPDALSPMVATRYTLPSYSILDGISNETTPEGTHRSVAIPFLIP